jgi:hypothetical protein
MTKAIITIGYEDYVMDVEDAVHISKILMQAEQYKHKWAKDEDGGTTHYIWPPEMEESKDLSKMSRSIKIIPDTLYRMAKLAGKPSDN